MEVVLSLSPSFSLAFSLSCLAGSAVPGIGDIERERERWEGERREEKREKIVFAKESRQFLAVVRASHFPRSEKDMAGRSRRLALPRTCKYPREQRVRPRGAKGGVS